MFWHRRRYATFARGVLQLPDEDFRPVRFSVAARYGSVKVSVAAARAVLEVQTWNDLTQCWATGTMTVNDQGDIAVGVDSDPVAIRAAKEVMRATTAHGRFVLLPWEPQRKL